MPRRLPTLIVLCLAASAQATDVYKWIDAGGVVHYADTEPPAEAKAQMMRVYGGKASAAADATAGDTDAQGGSAGRSKTVAAEAVLTGSALTEARCTRARAELELLQSATPVALAGSGGAKPQPLDDAGRRAQIENAQAVIARDCH